MFTGSIKWREKSPFDRTDLDALTRLRVSVPGAGSASLVAVSRSGFAVRGLDHAFSPKDLLAAWK